MDTVQRYHSNAWAVSVAELIHTHKHTCAERVRTTPWTRNSNSLLLVALRAPPAVSSEAISLWSPSTLVLLLFCLSLSLASLPFHPSLTSSTPLRGSLLHFPYFLLSLSLCLGVCCPVEPLAFSVSLTLTFG